jgi:hypothetical protein
MKLWYWILNGKLGIQKNLKQLELQVNELTTRARPEQR